MVLALQPGCCCDGDIPPDPCNVVQLCPTFFSCDLGRTLTVKDPEGNVVGTLGPPYEECIDIDVTGRIAGEEWTIHSTPRDDGWETPVPGVAELAIIEECVKFFIGDSSVSEEPLASGYHEACCICHSAPLTLEFSHPLGSCTLTYNGVSGDYEGSFTFAYEYGGVPVGICNTDPPGPEPLTQFGMATQDVTIDVRATCFGDGTWFVWFDFRWHSLYLREDATECPPGPGPAFNPTCGECEGIDHFLQPDDWGHGGGFDCGLAANDVADSVACDPEAVGNRPAVNVTGYFPDDTDPAIGWIAGFDCPSDSAALVNHLAGAFTMTGS